MNKNNISKKDSKGNISSELLKIEVTTECGVIKFKEQKQGTRVETSFMLIWQDSIKQVVRMKIEPIELLIFNFCIGELDMLNQVKISPTKISKEIGYSREAVSKAVSKLVDRNILIKNKNHNGIYSLNSEIGGKGRLSNLNYARKQALKENPTIDDLAEQVLSEIDPVQAQILMKYLEKQSLKK